MTTPSSDSLVSPDWVVQGNWDERLYGLKFVRGSLKDPPTPSLTGRVRCTAEPLQAAQRQRMKELATVRVATRTHAFGETKEPEERPLLQLLLGCDFFYLHFKHSLWPWEMNHSPISDAGFTLQTEDMRNFQPFLGRKRGHTLNSHRVFPSLPSVERNAPGKACTSSIDPGSTLVPCPEETWKYGQLYLKSQTSKSSCFTPKRKEWCLDFSGRLISSQQHGFYLWFIYFCNIQCGKTYGER